MRETKENTSAESSPMERAGMAGKRRPAVRRMVPALVLFAGGLVSCGTGATTGEGIRGTIIEPPLEKPDFVLTDTDGKPFDFRTETDGLLTLLFFGYTNCPDVCPVHMGNLGAVISKYPFETQSRIRVVFVTTDPVRDTPERMRVWLSGFGGDIVGLHGDLDEVNRIQAEMGLPPAIVPDSVETGVDYPVGHSARVLAFTPDNKGRVAYPFGTRQEDWVHDLPLLLKQRGW